jgi:hypothetical protein
MEDAFLLRLGWTGREAQFSGLPLKSSVLNPTDNVLVPPMSGRQATAVAWRLDLAYRPRGPPITELTFRSALGPSYAARGI